MALVRFVTGSAAAFQGLESKDQDTLYFITDERRLYKGDVPFSGGIYQTVAEFPEVGNVNTLYVNTANGQVCYWNGVEYVTVVKATGQTISGSGDNNTLPTTKAVVDYITSQIGALDITALEGRVSVAEGEIDTLQSQMSTVQGEGEGSINKALSDAKAYADSLAPNYAAAEHDHTLSEITDAGSLAGKNEVSEAELETALASKINNKADKATSLSGYGITDAYTKGEADSAIAAAIAAAPHLKRSIVSELPDAGSADQNTIYMVGTGEGSEDSNYKEYMVINGQFELIGDSKVDLTDYATKEYADQAEADAVQASKEYTDTEVASSLQEAKTYADQSEADAISAAKTYTDGIISGLDVTDVEVEGQYVSAVNEVDGKVVISRKQLPAKPVIETGNTNGTIKVDGSEVAVAGLGSMAYEEKGDFATAAQGALADTALQKEDITSGIANGTISVDGSDVAVKGLGSAAYTETSAYATSEQGTKADQSFEALTWGTI